MDSVFDDAGVPLYPEPVADREMLAQGRHRTVKVLLR
jgi:hypothetical protein